MTALDAAHDPAPGREDRGRVLLSLARGAIAQALGVGSVPALTAPWLDERGATFVTLTVRGGQLRGCIGSVTAHRALRDDVRENALAAAFHDPRFRPMERDEYPSLRIAVTLLSPLEDLPVEDEADAIRKLRPGVDGLVLRAGGLAATFIPAMWHKLPDPAAFLGLLRMKAGLPTDYWSPSLRLARFTGEEFEEEPRHHT